MDQQDFRNLVASSSGSHKTKREEPEWLRSDQRNTSRKRSRSELSHRPAEPSEHRTAVPSKSRVTSEDYVDRAAARRAAELDLDDVETEFSGAPVSKGTMGLDLEQIRAERARLAQAQSGGGVPTSSVPAEEDELEAAFKSPASTVPTTSAPSITPSTGPARKFKPITAAKPTTTPDGISLDEDGKPMYKIVNGKRMRRKRKPAAPSADAQPTQSASTPAGPPPPTTTSAPTTTLAPLPSVSAPPNDPSTSIVSSFDRSTKKERTTKPTKSLEKLTSSPPVNPKPTLFSSRAQDAPLLPRNVICTTGPTTSTSKPDTQSSAPADPPSELSNPASAAELKSKSDSPRDDGVGSDSDDDDDDDDIFAGAGEWRGPSDSESNSDEDEKDTAVATTKRNWFGDVPEPENTEPAPLDPTPPLAQNEEAEDVTSPVCETIQDSKEEPQPMRLTGLSSSALPASVSRAMLQEEQPDAPSHEGAPRGRTGRVHKRSRKGKSSGYGSD